MSTNSAWLGQNDTNGSYFPNSLLFHGTQKQLGWLGQEDADGTWIPVASLIYWQDTGNAPFVPPGPIGPGGPILSNGYLGLTFMKNVYVLTIPYWPDSLSQPWVGQLWPVPSPGGSQGQTWPFG